MERPHHLRLLHYRDERVIPDSNTSSIRGRKAMNDVVDGDRIERRRWCDRLRIISPPRGRKRKRKNGGRLISKVLIVHRFKFTTKTKLQPFPNHDTYAGVFRQAPGRTSFPRPGLRPRLCRPVHRRDEDVMVETILSEWWRSPRRVANW